MKKHVIATLLALALGAASLFAADTKGNAKTQWGVGGKLGSLTGVTVQYKMDKFDIIGGGNVGLWRNWVAGEAGVNFNIMSFDWTPGQWDWTIGAVGEVGFCFDDDDDGFYLGAFAPFRLNYTFPKAPWTLFVEVGPGLEILPSVDFDISAAIGGMYLFD